MAASDKDKDKDDDVRSTPSQYSVTSSEGMPAPKAPVRSPFSVDPVRSQGTTPKASATARGSDSPPTEAAATDSATKEATAKDSAAEESKAKDAWRPAERTACSVRGAMIARYESAVQQHQWLNQRCLQSKFWKAGDCSWQTAGVRARALREYRLRTNSKAESQAPGSERSVSHGPDRRRPSEPARPPPLQLRSLTRPLPSQAPPRTKSEETRDVSRTPRRDGGGSRTPEERDRGRRA
jgi:hypothetical protein